LCAKGGGKKEGWSLKSARVGKKKVIVLLGEPVTEGFKKGDFGGGEWEFTAVGVRQRRRGLP